jgi:hypothetical protein
MLIQEFSDIPEIVIFSVQVKMPAFPVSPSAARSFRAPSALPPFRCHHRLSPWLHDIKGKMPPLQIIYRTRDENRL